MLVAAVKLITVADSTAVLQNSASFVSVTAAIEFAVPLDLFPNFVAFQSSSSSDLISYSAVQLATG